ncbi:histidine phosphatase family protein [Caminicella sporogenes]|nr:histidine phosphatase family protein [Caminicella sporogenes]RKD28051.1 hypothetical protein BET04_01170 [Caminicella sporogenes]
MKKIYLVRHGETLWNYMSKTQGCKNILLSKKGIFQAKAVANRLSSFDEKYIKIYSSDLDRCLITAKYISQKINKEIEVLKDLREMNFGSWEGLTSEEIKQNYLSEYNIWRNTPHIANIPNGENLKSVQKRCLKAIYKICDEFEEGSVIIVSHGVAIKTIILGVLNIDLSNYYKISLNNGSINKIEIRSYGTVLTALNDTAHLE